MIYAVICDVSSLAHEGVLRQISPSLFSLVGDMGDAVSKKEREKAYISLALTYEYLTDGKSMPDVARDKEGKLFFKEKGTKNVPFPSFSLSHSGSLVAVLFSDTDEKIGVDIQLQTPLKNEEKIKKRLLHSSPQKEMSSSEIQVLCCNIDEALKLSPCKETNAISLSLPPDNKDFFSLWTQAEAALKADGGGFASICRLSAICSSAAVRTYKIDYLGQKYSLSVVKLKSS